MKKRNYISLLALSMLLAGCNTNASSIPTNRPSASDNVSDKGSTSLKKSEDTSESNKPSSSTTPSTPDVSEEKVLTQEDIDLVASKSITLTTDYNLRITITKGLETSVEENPSTTVTRMSDGFYQETMTSKEVLDENTYEVGEVTRKAGYFRDDKGVACYYTDPDINNTVAISPLYDSSYKELQFDDLIFQNVLGDLHAEDFYYDKSENGLDVFSYDYYSISDRNALSRFNDVYRMTINSNTHPTLTTFQNLFQAGNIRLKEAYVEVDNLDVVGYGGTYSMNLDLTDFGSVGTAKFESTFHTVISDVDETEVTLNDIETKPYEIKAGEKEYYDALDKALSDLRKGSYTYSSTYKDADGLLYSQSLGYVTKDGYGIYDYYREYQQGSISQKQSIYTSEDRSYTLLLNETERGTGNAVSYSGELIDNNTDDTVCTFTYNPSTNQIGHDETEEWPYDGSNKILFQNDGKTLRLDLSSATHPEISVKATFVYSGTISDKTDISLSSEIYSGVHKVKDGDYDNYSSEDGNQIQEGTSKALKANSGLPTFEFAKELFDYVPSADENYHFTLKSELNPAYVAPVFTNSYTADSALTLDLTVSKAGVFRSFEYTTADGTFQESFTDITATAAIPASVADFSSYTAYKPVENYSEIHDVIDDDNNTRSETAEELLEALYGTGTNLDSCNIFASSLVQKLYRYAIYNKTNKNVYFVLSTEGNDAANAYDLFTEVKDELTKALSLSFVDSTDGTMLTQATVFGGKGKLRLYVTSTSSSRLLVIRFSK